MRSLAFWSLVPLLAPQGLWLRATARRLDPPGGPVAGSVGAGDSLRVLVLGDSVVAGVGAPTVERALAGSLAAALAERCARRVDWAAAGRNGARIGDVLGDLLPTAPMQAVDLVVLSVGINDVTGLARLGVWRSRLAATLGTFRRRAPDAAILVTGVPPLAHFPVIPQPLRAVLAGRGRQFDAATRAICAPLPRTLFVQSDFVPAPDDFADDGYHPGPRGYAGWAHLLAVRAAALMEEAN